MDKLTTKPTIPPRKKLTHGITFWLRTGKVNPSIRGYKKIQKYLADLEAQLIEEGGGQANLTAAREILVRSTIRGYGVIMLAELYASRYSVVRPDQAKHGVLVFQPVLERGYTAILAQIRANLLALGLDRREARETFLTIDELGAKIHAEALEIEAKTREAAEKADLVDAGGHQMPQDARSPAPEAETTPGTTDNSGNGPGGENSNIGGNG